LLADADEFDGELQFVIDGHDDAALGGAVVKSSLGVTQAVRRDPAPTRHLTRHAPVTGATTTPVHTTTPGYYKRTTP